MVRLHINLMADEVMMPMLESLLDGEQLLLLDRVAGHPLRVEGDGVLLDAAGALA